MQLIATHINYYYICHRKLWLFANGINMEHTSDAVSEGKLLHDTAYPQRAEKYTEITVGGSKIDFYDANKKIIHEIKKSDKMETAHEWQVKYYIWLLQQNGINDVKGILEYPKLRETKQVELSQEDINNLQKASLHINQIIGAECPSVINAVICKKCSYYDFCYATES